MNQILGDEYNPNGNGGNTDKVIRIFAILMIIFAIALISSGVYSYVQNQEISVETKEPEKTTAKITAEEEDGKVKIVVEHDKAIKQLAYTWNGNKENKVQGEGNTLEKFIDLPAGDNVLFIKVTDEEDGKTEFEQNFSSENGIDILNPEIKMEVVGAKLKITAKDESELKYLTYRWNDEEETTVNPKEDNKKEIIIEIDIRKDSNELSISAVDTSNNPTYEVKTFVGVKKPEILIEASADGSTLDITCKHEKGIKKVEYTLNGIQYAGEFDDSPTNVQFTQPLDPGYNRIILTATSVEQTDCTFDGETNYYPEGSSSEQQ